MLPKAQEAYDAALANLAFVDTGPFMEAITPLINDAIARGAFVTTLQPLEPLVAEKAAIELEALGYWAMVYPSNQMIAVGDGSYKPGFMVHVNWKQLPANTRDKFTV